MPQDQEHVVVAGGGLAAARTVQQLRRRGHQGPITLVSAEHHLPYDRPPLSKAVLLGQREAAPLPFDPEALGVTLMLGARAKGLDLSVRRVLTSHGEVSFDQLVIATGSMPVRLPGAGPQLTLRTIDDALALRSLLVEGAHVAVIGASWIGAEVACAALARGCRVTCVEGAGSPLAAALGTGAGRRFLPWWHDIDLRLDLAVHSAEEDGVHCVDGSVVAADVVVTGVGVRPAVEWLESSGLEIDRGVVVDEHLRASHVGVYAVGDVAARWSPRYGRTVRIQHWDAAAMASTAVAANIVTGPDGELTKHDPVPYFWSDQFCHKIQYVGLHDSADELVWREDGQEPGLTGTWLDPEGRMTAVLTVDRPRESAAAGRMLASGQTPNRDALVSGTSAFADLLAV